METTPYDVLSTTAADIAAALTGDGTAMIATIGGGLMVLSVVALLFKWGKAAIFG